MLEQGYGDGSRGWEKGRRQEDYGSGEGGRGKLGEGSREIRQTEGKRYTFGRE